MGTILEPKLQMMPIHPPGFAPVTDEALTGIVNKLVKALHPEQIILFGSFAYGEPTVDSDVDLLVIMETDDSPVERYVTVSSLLTPRPFPLDILVKTPAEIATALTGDDFFIEEIMAQGKRLYEQSH